MPKAPTKKAPKTETVTVRLNPKLKYGLELLSRKQYRSVSSTLEWIISASIKDEFGSNPSIDELWDVEECDRLIKLGLHHESLMTYDEQAIWKLIKENGFFWRGRFNPNWEWKIQESSVAWANVRKSWDLLQQVAEGQISKSKLPTWQQTKSEVEVDDDIPF